MSIAETLQWSCHVCAELRPKVAAWNPELEAEIVRQLTPVALQGAWPIIYSAGFAGVVALILLWILHRTLAAHTKAQIENTATLNEIAKDLKAVVDAFKGVERFIERRRPTR